MEEEPEVEDVEAEEVTEDIDMQVAKEIYENVDDSQPSDKDDRPKGDDKGEQLSLF